MTSLNAYLRQARQTYPDDSDKMPMVQALYQMLEALNTPQKRPVALRPTGVIHALSKTLEGASSILNSDQQDAQEFFTVLLDAIDNEITTLDKESVPKSTGLAGLTEDRSSRVTSKIRNPFRSLMAHRIACATCGSSSAIRHQPADHFSFVAPSAV